jgi:glycosyltransferase involved in cell wall biosynthesis
VKISILLIGNFLSVNGVNRSVGEELAERLKGAGYLIKTTSHRQSRLLRLLDMISTVWMRRRDYQVAYVEVYSGDAFLWAEIVCRVLNLVQKPYVLALHGGNLPTFAQRWPGRVKRLLQGASIVTAPSRYLLEEMRPYRSDICLLPNPIDLGLYSYCLRSNPSPHLVWLRAFHAIYYPQMTPQVIAKLRESFPEITLTMVGPDKRDGALQETRTVIEKLGLQKNIEIILGVSKSQVPNILGQGNIFINTTNVDNTPVSVIEAMGCGLCIVSTNVGGIPYLLEDGIDALLVPPNNPEAMSNAVRRIFDDPGLAEKLSRNARNKAERFDWSVVLPQWEKIFQEIIER